MEFTNFGVDASKLSMYTEDVDLNEMGPDIKERIVSKANFNKKSIMEGPGVRESMVSSRYAELIKPYDGIVIHPIPDESMNPVHIRIGDIELEIVDCRFLPGSGDAGFALINPGLAMETKGKRGILPLRDGEEVFVGREYESSNSLGLERHPGFPMLSRAQFRVMFNRRRRDGPAIQLQQLGDTNPTIVSFSY